MIRALLTSVLVLSGAISPAMAEDTAPAIFLVRHAEKESGRDPALTTDGALRASRLADQLQNTGIEVIYSTNYKRTLETAGPLADALGLEITLYDPADLPGFADHLKTDGKPALVVGHSNTTPQLVVLLGGEAEPMPETEYDRLYCVQESRTVLLTAGGAPLKAPGCP